jgi:hypothetical protein
VVVVVVVGEVGKEREVAEAGRVYSASWWAAAAAVTVANWGRTRGRVGCLEPRLGRGFMLVRVPV